MKKINAYLIYIYFAPLILSLYLISVSGYLLGDFRSFSYSLSPIDIISVLLFYFVPFLMLYVVIKITNRVKVKDFSDLDLEGFLFKVFIFIGIVTIFFGANKIGQDPVPGLSGVFIKIAGKLNPLALLPLIAFSKISTKKFFICLLVTALYGYRQESLQGYFITLLCLGVFIIKNYNLKTSVFIFILAIPFIFSGPVLSLASYLYSIRNEMRGVGFNLDEILSLAIGRVSTTSSLLFIESNSFDFNAISDYFSLGIISERLIGLSSFGSVTPSDIFNLQTIGAGQSYSIFMGLPGFLFFLFNGDAFTAIFNLLFLTSVFVVIYLLIPVVDKKNRVCVFFLVMFFPLLSFDIWEISIAFQTVIIWRVLIFLLVKRRKITS